MVLKLRDFLPQNLFPAVAEDVFQQQVFSVSNFIGQWDCAGKTRGIPNPLTNKLLVNVPDTQPDRLDHIITAMQQCPRYGLHNPLYRRDRYVQYGTIFGRAADTLTSAPVAEYFARLIDLVMPKGMPESMGEVTVVRDFLYNLAGDGCRNLAEGFSRPGNRDGQEASGYRWSYGPVAIISPFNFPLEILALQVGGALAMGNKVLLKPDQRVAIVADAFVRLLLACGMPETDLILLNADGRTTQKLVTTMQRGQFVFPSDNVFKFNVARPLFRMIQFTGSTKVAQRLLRVTAGRVKIEDSGFDWKLLGPNFCTEHREPVAQQCDKDAYAASGQKCSAQSFLIAHSNWMLAGLVTRLGQLALQRGIDDLSAGPILTWSNPRIAHHLHKLLKIPGSCLCFGGKALETKSYQIPKEYGYFQPTAVFIPLAQIPQHFDLVTREVFAPVQIITTWQSKQDLELVIEILNNLENNLTAGVVDRDVTFVEHVLGRTINGTTYAGILGRTTGAPQWHWFGPAGHPAAAGIGTPEAIRAVWSCHREIVRDWGNYSPSTLNNLR